MLTTSTSGLLRKPGTHFLLFLDSAEGSEGTLRHSRQSVHLRLGTSDIIRIDNQIRVTNLGGRLAVLLYICFYPAATPRSDTNHFREIRGQIPPSS
jgi:hypothetical protein